MLLRQAIRKILSKLSLDSRDLLSRLDSLSDLELILELQKLYGLATNVKTSQEILTEDLTGGKPCIAVMTGDERTLRDLGGIYPENVLIHGNDEDSFYELLAFFYTEGCLETIILERTEERTLVQFSHFCTRISQYYAKSDNVKLFIKTPVNTFENFNPFFIPKKALIANIQDIKHGGD